MGILDKKVSISVEGILEMIGIRKVPRYGIAFGGGGARGFFHIGVLTAFEKYGIKPQILSGVSAGSIAAVLYASGLTPNDMIECFSFSSKFTDYTEWTIPRQGFLKLDRFASLLDSWLPVKNLEDLNIPTVVCATNFDKGSSVGWCKGEIVPRVMASCSIPIVFQPIRINGVNYVDGGVLRNLPAWAIRDYCKMLFGSNCSPLGRDYTYRHSILDIAMRSYQLMAKANVLQDMNLCDYTIMSDTISRSKTFDMSNLRKNVNLGYEAACRILENIKP